MGAKEDFEEFTNFFTNHFKMEGEALSKMVSQAMEAKGHKRVTSWADADPDDTGKGDGNPFKSGGRGKRPVSGAADDKGKDDNGGFFGLGA